MVLLGIGMGRNDLTPQALALVESAEILAGGKRQLSYFPEHSGERLYLQSPLSDALADLDRISLTRRTVVLASGDPFFYGIGQRLVRLLGRDRLFTIPNVTTIQSLFARLSEPWDDVHVISLHGREDSGWTQAFRQHSRIALFTDGRRTPAWIAERLLDSGFDDFSLIVAEDLGLPTESIRTFSPDAIQGCMFSPLNIVVVLRNDDDRRSQSAGCLPVLGLAEDAFQHQAGLITKMEVRAVALAQLQLTPGAVLWDLGAGSGSVSIEASRIAPLRKVVAVEKDPGRYRDLIENIRRFRCAEIEAIQGRALDIINDLPDPDRVFIGGSGGELQELLQQTAGRLRPGGRVVLTIVTLENLDTARSFWQKEKLSFDMNVTQLQISRSAPIGKALRMDALNPVFIVTAWRREHS